MHNDIDVMTCLGMSGQACSSSGGSSQGKRNVCRRQIYRKVIQSFGSGLEKVERHAARFVHNNYWPLASVTQMISILDWETLETRRQKVCLSMLYKAINGLTAIPMDHYQPSMATSI